MHTVDAACVNSRANTSTAVIAGKVRRRGELTTFPAYAISTLSSWRVVRAANEGHGFSRAALALTVRALQAAEKLISAEGDGLQAVHNCFEMNSALAAEG